MNKELGKIQKAEFGFGGSHDTMIGLTLTLGGKSWGVGDFIHIHPAQSSGDGFERLKTILTESKKTHVGQLIGVPVECSFEGGILREWRVLTEVL